MTNSPKLALTSSLVGVESERGGRLCGRGGQPLSDSGPRASAQSGNAEAYGFARGGHAIIRKQFVPRPLFRQTLLVAAVLPVQRFELLLCQSRLCEHGRKRPAT